MVPNAQWRGIILSDPREGETQGKGLGEQRRICIREGREGDCIVSPRLP